MGPGWRGCADYYPLVGAVRVVVLLAGMACPGWWSGSCGSRRLDTFRWVGTGNNVSQPTVACSRLGDVGGDSGMRTKPVTCRAVRREAGPLAGYVTAGVLYPASGHITCQRPAALQDRVS
jgi:hypothetical protein